ncbi:MAG: hypothetical protein Greene041679_287 [Parcubacteria group bacterium Greene0416_79]|nr:MAG: hypothetical protein Greene041679_287 [Parcubacteria group bacterium Greene0416_79]
MLTPMALYIVISAFLVMCVSFAGVAFVQRNLSAVLARNLKILVAFAAGVFAVLSYSLFDEAIGIGISLPVLLFSALGGALFLETADRLIPHEHHHHGTEHDHPHGRVDAHRMLLGDAVHNIADGIILVPAFLADVWIGIGTVAGIILHELVQEIAEFFVLKEAGYTTKEALVRNFVVSSTIFIGVILAFSVARVEEFEAPLLAFGAGGFTYILLRDLLPSIVGSVRKDGHAPQFAAAALIGAGILLGIQTFMAR